MMHRTFLLGVLLAIGGLSARAVELIRDEDVMVRMRDGVQLATDIYRPQGHDALPVLLHRTPYGKSDASAVSIAENLAAHGYVVMLQDTRGRHRSQGVFEKYYAFDAYDGFDTVEWAATRPYANGQVGMYGTSYAAHTQADASKLAPPHLKSLLLNMGGMANAWDHSVRYDGAFELGRQLTWAWQQAHDDAKDPIVRALLEKEDVNAWYQALPLRRGSSPLSIAPNFEKYYLDEATHSDYDDHWTGLGMQWEKYYRETADVPMMHVGGWYDIYLRGTIANWKSLSGLKKSPQRLLIGPWTHHGNKESFAGDVDFGKAAGLTDFDADFHLRWFDYTLKGNKTAAANEAPVHFFLMGGGDGAQNEAKRLQHGGEWHDAEEWPPRSAHEALFYLHADGRLDRQRPASGEVERTQYAFDPRHPVPTLGGGVSRRLKDGAYDQRERADMPGSRPPYLPLSSRSDVLVFQSEPLQQELILEGPVQVELQAASSGVDTDFTAKLVDVYPPSADYPGGFAMNLTDGIVRASYRDQSPTRRLLQPGEIYKITVRPFDTANRIKRGHRLRLDISSSNFPRFDINPNTGEPLGMNRLTQVVTNSVYHSSAHPSILKVWLAD